MEQTFSHRFNPDGTIDSICHLCIKTIGTVTREADLESHEQQHVCDPYDRLRYESLYDVYA